MVFKSGEARSVTVADLLDRADLATLLIDLLTAKEKKIDRGREFWVEEATFRK